jgi:hypothetical protein
VKAAAKTQLQLVPRSDNERARQSSHRKAVVSIRFPGAVIGKLDIIAARINEAEGRHHWNRITRTKLVEQAVNEYIARIEQEAPAKKAKRK